MSILWVVVDEDGALVREMGASPDREETEAAAQKLWRGEAVPLRLHPPAPFDPGMWAQQELPWEVIRPRGQSEWGVDLALEALERWGLDVVSPAPEVGPGGSDPGPASSG